MSMNLDIEPVYAQRWHEEEGYVSTGEIIGYAAMSGGQVQAYGETPDMAVENALEAQWGVSSRSDGDTSSSVVASR